MRAGSSPYRPKKLCSNGLLPLRCKKMNNGYVSLHRKMFDNKLWLLQKFTKAQAWIDLFGNANHKDNSFWIRNNEIKVLRGQIAWSEVTMSKRWKWSRERVRRFLKWLENEGNIRQQKSPLTTIVTIVSYDSYQSNKTSNKTAETTKRDSRRDSRRDTNNNDNNDNKDNKDTSDGVPSQDIQSFINLFKDVNPSFERLFGNTTERGSATRLIKKYGMQKMEATLKELPNIISQPYAPKITTPNELERNLGKLLAFVGQQKIINKPKSNLII